MDNTFLACGVNTTFLLAFIHTHAQSYLVPPPSGLMISDFVVTGLTDQLVNNTDACNLSEVNWITFDTDIGKQRPAGQTWLAGLSNPPHQLLVQGMLQTDVDPLVSQITTNRLFLLMPPNGARHQICHIISKLSLKIFHPVFYIPPTLNWSASHR